MAPDHGALDDIAQLSNVSRPRVSSEGIQAVFTESLDGLAVFAVEMFDEVLDERRRSSSRSRSAGNSTVKTFRR